MCGIGGIFLPGGRGEVAVSVLDRMIRVMHHRGPDDHDVHVEPGVGLAHRRLSIIDIGGGHQPFYNEDGSVVTVYNGEIYNYRELFDELIAAGHGIGTGSDTETIVHGWEGWGVECVHRYRGMFAFALWDRNRRELFLARDRLGIKPLYYAELPSGALIFASELKGLLCQPDFPRDLCERAVEDYFTLGYVPEPRTIFKAARKLAAGHWLHVRAGEPIPQPTQYWDVKPTPENDIGEQAAIETLCGHLRDAVELRMIADVPLGGFLSGGVDSSAVVATMAELSPEPVNTCTISFGDPRFNESQYANDIALRYQTNHQVRQLDPEDISLVDDLAEVYDEPFADPSAIPTYRLCQLARERVTVALSGDGGDEIFAGYRRQRMHMMEERLRSRLPASLRQSIFGPLGALYPKADWAPKILRAKTTFQALALDPAAAYLHSVSVTSEALRERFFTRDFRRQLGGYRTVELFRMYAERMPSPHSLELIQYLDLKTWLPGDILTKVDRASMAHSLEVRVPILDHILVEWAARLPSRLKLNRQEGKYIFKKSLSNRVPEEILHRPKMGFSIPLASWFRGPLRERLHDAVLGPGLSETGMFDVACLHDMVDRHHRGVSDYSTALWALTMFGSFLNRVARAS